MDRAPELMYLTFVNLGRDGQLAGPSIQLQPQLSKYRNANRSPAASVSTSIILLLLPYSCSPSTSPTPTPGHSRFTSTWTSLTAGAYTLLFLHPAWSKHPVASVGAQAIWVFITWLFWVVGASIVNKPVSSLVDEKVCGSVAYCAQIRGLFGAFGCFISSFWFVPLSL